MKKIVRRQRRFHMDEPSRQVTLSNRKKRNRAANRVARKSRRVNRRHKR